MGSPRHRVTGVAEPLLPRFATLATTFVVLVASVTASFTYVDVAQVLVTAAAAVVLTAVLASACRHVVQPLGVRASPSGVAGAVAASTAYWCALDAPSCPHRPRAPGRH